MPDRSYDRLLAAPPDRVWRAWSEAGQLCRWVAPASARAVGRLDPYPGGAAMLRLGGVPRFDGCVLAFEPGWRLALTDALGDGWAPHRAPLAVTLIATMTLTDDGTLCRLTERRGDPDAPSLPPDDWPAALDRLAAHLSDAAAGAQG